MAETDNLIHRKPPAGLSSSGKRIDTHSIFLRLRREDIAYFRFIIESYEGMAVVRTKDPREAVVELMVAPGWEKDVEEVLEGLRKEFPFEIRPSS